MFQNQPARTSERRRGFPSLSRAKQMLGAALLAATLALLTAPAQRPRTMSSSPRLEMASLQTGGGLQITMSPTLSPAFDPNISDYVVTSNANPRTLVSVKAPRSMKVSIDGQPFRNLAFTTSVSLNPGQSFSFVVNTLTSSKTYYVRCLPTDFPTWKTERPGTPLPEYFVIAPNLSFSAASRKYAIIADSYGVPIWWYKSANPPVDAKLLPDGNMGLISFGTGEERKLDGTLARTFTPDSSIGGSIDNHELLLLPNGDYIYIIDVNRGPVDLRPYGGPANANVVDNVIEEFAPNGSLVWHWSAMDHLAISETVSHWWSQYLVNSPADPYHMNSVEPDNDGTNDGFVVSLRHLDALIRIDKATGNIVWKLGGVARAESLTFVGDAYSNFGGQHYARILSDGTLTLHDNGTQQNRAPRAVRYTIDPVAKTATFVEQVKDVDVSGSGCCGSAQKLSGGDWVMSWGGNPVVTELAADGSRVFRMTFQGPYFSYRAVPVPFGNVSRTALRSGMNAQFPR